MILECNDDDTTYALKEQLYQKLDVVGFLKKL